MKQILTTSQIAEELERETWQRIESERNFHRRFDGHPDITSIPPDGCPFKVGDKVTFTNDYGVVFKGFKVLAFDTNPRFGSVVYINTDCYWAPKRIKNLTLEN